MACRRKVLLLVFASCLTLAHCEIDLRSIIRNALEGFASDLQTQVDVTQPGEGVCMTALDGGLQSGCRYARDGNGQILIY